MTYCDLDEIDYIITNAKPGEKYLDYVKKHDIKLVVANELHSHSEKH